MEDRQFTVTLEGGRPWGFSLQGGLEFRSPLRVGKVRERGKEREDGGGRGREGRGGEEEERLNRGLIHPCASTDMHTLHTVYLVWHLSTYMHVCAFSHVNGIACGTGEVTLQDNGRWLWPGIL